MTLFEKGARTLKLAAMVSIALVIFVGCSKDEDKKPGPVGPGGSLGNYKEPEMGNAYLGNTLTLSGQVYKNTNNYPNPYEKWNGNATVTSYYAAYNDGEITGKITNGQLSFTVGQPVPDYAIESLETVEELFGGYSEFYLTHLYDNVTYSQPDVKTFILWGFNTEEYYGIVKGGYTYADQGMFAEYVFYV